MKFKTITRRDGKQTNVAVDPEQVKAAMKPVTVKPKKDCSLPYESKATELSKEEVFTFAANGYPKILPYFTPRNPDYRVAYRYLGGEDILHIAIAALMIEYFPSLKFFHTKNEGKEGNVGRAKKQLMCVMPGVTDFCIQHPKKIETLWLEVKRKPNRLTDDQIKFMAFQKVSGNMAETVYTITDALEAILFYNNKK